MINARTARRIAELTAEIDEKRREVERLKLTLTFSLATQYALDFAVEGESIIVTEELAEDMRADLSCRIELEDDEIERMIEEAVTKGELKRATHISGSPGLEIPFRTWRKTGY